MTNEEIAWIAGIIEGEGTFGLRHNGRKTSKKLYPFLEIDMTDKDVIEKLNKLIGGHIYVYERGKDGDLGKKSVYRVAIASKHELEPLLKSILPMMGIRRKEKILTLLEWYS